MDLGAADVERRDLLRLGALDERGAGDDHVRLLGHVDAVGDDRHVAAARDAVAEHAGDLRHAVRAEQRVHLEDVAGAVRAREALALLGQEQPAAVDQVDGRQPQPQRHHLRALDLLRRAWPPRAGGDGVVVRDHHAPAPGDARECGDDAGGGRALVVGKHVAVVDERADLERARAGIGEHREPFARGALALGVHAVDVLGAPAGVDLDAALAQPALEHGQRRAMVRGGAVVDESVQRVADGNERDEGHLARTLAEIRPQASGLGPQVRMPIRVTAARAFRPPRTPACCPCRIPC